MQYRKKNDPFKGAKKPSLNDWAPKNNVQLVLAAVAAFAAIVTLAIILYELISLSL